MAGLPEINQWDQLIYRLSPEDKVLGGPQGIANQPAQQIANRTNWLRSEAELHEHSLRYYTRAETDAQLEGLEVAEHSHDDRYVVKNLAITQVLSQLQNLLQEHTHDERYYLKHELDSIISGSKEYVHRHDELYYRTAALLDKLIFGTISVDHTHSNIYYSQTEISALFSSLSEVEHSHDARYYTRDRLSTIFTNLLNFAHNHDTLYYKTSELVPLIPMHDHDDRYYKRDYIARELDTLSDVEHNHAAEGYLSYAEFDNVIANVSFTGHTHDILYYHKDYLTTEFDQKSNTYHTHFEDYFTETEVANFAATKANRFHNHYEDFVSAKISVAGEIEIVDTLAIGPLYLQEIETLPVISQPTAVVDFDGRI